MPAPDPEGVWIEEPEPGRYSTRADIWPGGNRKSRIARMMAMHRNARFDGWRCLWCGDLIPTFRRTDARFCCEGCRKRAARKWRARRLP